MWIVDQWLKIKGEVHLLNSLEIPRWVNYMPDHEMELHGFCDASQPAIGAVIYVKNVTLNSVLLLVSKARVAPKKDLESSKLVTIP